MTEGKVNSPGIIRLEPFAALADIYQPSGMADYSKELAPRLFDLAFELEWMGRTLLDLGCGTGDLACWFSERGFRVEAVDLSASMLRYAKETAAPKGLGVHFAQGDMRTYKPDMPFEMVTCVGGSLNYLPTLRDVETVFRMVNATLLPQKLFFFDLHTIKGLYNTGLGDKIIYNNDTNLMIITHSNFNFETLMLTQQYIILPYDPQSGTWQRAEEVHTIRGYPVQAVGNLLAKTGFRVLRTVTPNMELATDDEEHVIIVAMKEG